MVIYVNPVVCGKAPKFGWKVGGKQRCANAFAEHVDPSFNHAILELFFRVCCFLANVELEQDLRAFWRVVFPGAVGAQELRRFSGLVEGLA